MRIVPAALAFFFCFAPAIRAAEFYAIQPVTPGNSVVYPKRLRVPRDALSSLRGKAAAGDAQAQRNMGEKLLMLDERAEAGMWLKKSAERGNADALYLLGYMAYEENKTDEAIAWFEKSSANGNTEALVSLGDIYWFMRKDPAKSFSYYKSGAEKGNTNAQFRLADCFSRGSGVKKDMRTGLAWLKRSAGNGLTDPMIMLFEIYSDPRPANLCGVKTNPAKAVYWLERATVSRAGSALFALLDILENGKGEIPPNPARGWLWTRWALDALESHDAENIFFNKPELERKAALFKEKMSEAECADTARTFKEWMNNGYPALVAAEPE